MAQFDQEVGGASVAIEGIEDHESRSDGVSSTEV